MTAQSEDSLIEAMARAMGEANGVGCASPQLKHYARAALTALRAQGYAVVPREASAAMCEAGSAHDRKDIPPVTTSQADAVWTAMLAAAEEGP